MALLRVCLTHNLFINHLHAIYLNNVNMFQINRNTFITGLTGREGMSPTHRKCDWIQEWGEILYFIVRILQQGNHQIKQIQ